MDDGYYRADGDVYTMVIYSVTPTFTDPYQGFSGCRDICQVKASRGYRTFWAK